MKQKVKEEPRQRTRQDEVNHHTQVITVIAAIWFVVLIVLLAERAKALTRVFPLGLIILFVYGAWATWKVWKMPRQ